MALLPHIFVLPLALGLLAGTAFKPIYAQQAQDDCPEDYHQVAPYDSLHCESNGSPPHIHIHPPHGSHGGECRQAYLLTCRCIEGQHPFGDGCSPCAEVGRTLWCVD
jgi:hypothetical protein